jgi:NAD(P)-dependent dehydrogenase (short-subunit alcohol dehydrogenase family)
MKAIRGKTAMVTGAASGIGRAIALELAREGARVYMIDVDEPALQAVADEVRALGVDALARVCDVSDPAQNTAAVQYLLQQWTTLDILVNNAGITYYGRTLAMSAEHWNRLLAINLHAPIQFTRELMPALLKRGDAHVLNVASILGLVGLARVTAYCTSKFGLVGFSESLRHECGRMGLGVTALCPGFVNTQLFDSAPLGHDLYEPKKPPRWSLITPEAVAERAVKAIYRNQGVVVMQPTSRLLYWAKRFAPSLLDLVHRVRIRQQDAPTPPRTPEEGLQKTAA